MKNINNMIECNSCRKVLFIPSNKTDMHWFNCPKCKLKGSICDNTKLTSIDPTEEIFYTLKCDKCGYEELSECNSPKNVTHYRLNYE